MPSLNPVSRRELVRKLKARSLEIAPADDADLQWSIRAQLSGWRTEVTSLKAVLPQKHPVWAVAFSPDGKTLVSAGYEKETDGKWRGNVRRWEAGTGQPRGKPLQHKGWVWAVAFSPRGETLKHQGSITVRGFSQDGKTLVTGSAGRKIEAIKVYRELTGAGLAEAKAAVDKQ